MADYKSLNTEDVKVIESVKRRIDSTIEILVSDLQYLIDNLQTYKEDVDSTIKSSLVEADILVQYHGINNSSYNLPGTFASITASFDLATMRKDNEKLKIAQDEHESADKRRSSTYSIISQTYNEVRNRLNLLANDNVGITQLIEDLKDKTPFND